MAAWTYIQNFNSLNTADLTGQDSWSGDVLFDVQESVVQEGAKAVLGSPPSSTEIYIARTLPAGVDSGTMIFYVRATKTSGEAGSLQFRVGTTFAGRIRLNADIYIDGLTDGTIIKSAFGANTWYKITVEFLSSTTFRAKVDEGAFSAAITYGGGQSNPDTLRFTAYDTGSIYWDNINDGTIASSIKTINGLIKASIKTVNNLAIASVKNWNGLV